jgi:hypothetical protein
MRAGDAGRDGPPSRSADLWQSGLIGGNLILSAAMSAYLGQNGLIQAESTLSRRIQGYLRGFPVIQEKTSLSVRIQGYPGEFKVIHADFKISRKKRAYRRRFQVIQGVAKFILAKQVDFAINRVIRLDAGGRDDGSAGWNVEEHAVEGSLTIDVL